MGRFRNVVCVAILLACGCGGSEIQVVKDPFGGIRRGFVVALGWGFNRVGVSETKGVYTLSVVIARPGQSRVIVPAGEKCQFAVGGDIITLTTPTESVPVANATQTSIYSQWKFTFTLSKEEISRFGQAPLTAVKIMVGNDEHQAALDPGEAKRFQHNLIALTTDPATNGK